MDQSMKFPVGFRFSPFDTELVSSYLKPQILGQKLPCNIVEEKQLYGPNANPWQIFDPDTHPWILSELAPGKFEKVTYVFVNLTKKATLEKKKKVSKEHYLKKAGCGTWTGQTKRYEIRDCNGDVIGEKRFLVFEINDDSHQDLSKVGYWKMHEYQLRGINDDISNPCNTVLCKITFDASKKPQVNLRPKVNNDHPVESSSEPQKKNTNVDSVSSSTINSGTVDGNQAVSENYGEAITTQTSGDDLVVSDDSYRDKENQRYSGPEIIEICDDEVELVSDDSYRDKGKEGSSGPEIVEICDDEVEFVDISDIEESTLVTASSPAEQIHTSYPKPVPSDFCWPAIYNNDYEKIKKEGGRRELNSGKTKVHFSGYQEPNKEQPIEDSTTVLGKRKSIVETLCAINKKLKPASSDICCPAKHDNDYQKTENICCPASSNICCPAKHDNDYQKTEKEAAGASEELISNFINFL